MNTARGYISGAPGTGRTTPARLAGESGWPSSLGGGVFAGHTRRALVARQTALALHHRTTSAAPAGYLTLQSPTLQQEHELAVGRLVMARMAELGASTAVALDGRGFASKGIARVWTCLSSAPRRPKCVDNGSRRAVRHREHRSLGNVERKREHRSSTPRVATARAFAVVARQPRAFASSSSSHPAVARGRGAGGSRETALPPRTLRPHTAGVSVTSGLRR